MATVVFESSDGKKFVVPLAVATYSTTIKTMLDNLGLGMDDEGSETEVIPVPNVKGSILEKILEWAEHEQEEPTGRTGNLNDDNDDNDMNEWEKKYLEVDDETLYDLTRAANYLDVKGLLDLCCAAIANKIAGKNPRQIRELFGLPWPTVEKKNKQRKSTSTSSSSA